MSELSERLKMLREDKNISMDKMCEDLSKIYSMNLAKSTISKWENGKSEPTMSYARVLAKYFDVSLDYIIGLNDKKSNKMNNQVNNITEQFITPEAAMKFILEQPAIAAFGGFDVNKMTDEELMEFANELLNQLKLLGFKYKK